jgi:hypothetical protein
MLNHLAIALGAAHSLTLQSRKSQAGIEAEGDRAIAPER